MRDNDWNVEDALPAYQTARAPILAKIVGASRASANWYEEFDTHMKLDAYPFALSYIRRAGRLDAARLERLAPRFTQTLREKGIALESAA